MPKTSKKRNQEGTLDVTAATLQQLSALQAEVLRLHLLQRSLVTTGTKAVMAKRLYEALHNFPVPSADAAAQPSAVQSSGSNDPPP